MRKDDKTPKERGFAYASLDEQMQEDIDLVMQKEHCKTRPEALRLVLRYWKRSAQPAEIGKNAEVPIWYGSYISIYKLKGENIYSGTYVPVPDFTT